MINETIFIQHKDSIKAYKLSEVALFNYNKISRNWTFVDSFGSEYKLPSHVNSELILSTSKAFLQINLHCIVNTALITEIKAKSVVVRFDDNLELEFKLTSINRVKILNKFNVLG